MSKITNLEDKNNNIVYPITVTDAVVMSDKTTKVEDAINARAKINVTDTDVGEGATLASGEFLAVYGEGGQVQTTDIANSAVNTAKIANNAVTTAKIGADIALIDADGTVETEDPWIGTSMVLWQQFLSKIYPIGSRYSSTTLTTTQQVSAALGGTWVLESSYNEIVERVIARKYVVSGGTTAQTFSFTTADYDYELKFRVQMESNTGGYIGVYCNGVTSGNQRSYTVCESNSIVSTVNGSNEMIWAQNTQGYQSMQLEGTLFTTHENNVNWRRWLIRSGTCDQNRTGTGCMGNANEITSLTFTINNGAQFDRALFEVTGKKDLGKVYRYRRTA